MATHENTQIEVTDTFGGEANYSWCRRYTIEHTEGKSRLAIVRAVKKMVGWNGLRCAVTDYGDGLEIRPQGMCQICFVSFHAYGSAS